MFCSILLYMYVNICTIWCKIYKQINQLTQRKFDLTSYGIYRGILALGSVRKDIRGSIRKQFSYKVFDVYCRKTTV